jgi:hypothetical protein
MVQELKEDLRTVPEVRDFQARPSEEATFAISHSLLGAPLSGLEAAGGPHGDGRE